MLLLPSSIPSICICTFGTREEQALLQMPNTGFGPKRGRTDWLSSSPYTEPSGWGSGGRGVVFQSVVMWFGPERVNVSKCPWARPWTPHYPCYSPQRVIVSLCITAYLVWKYITRSAVGMFVWLQSVLLKPDQVKRHFIYICIRRLND